MAHDASLKPVPLWSAPPENLLVEIFGALGVKEIHFISADIFWTNRVPYLRNGES